MARLDKVGAFALTKPLHGSDSVALERRPRRAGTVTSHRGTSPRRRRRPVKVFLVEKGAHGLQREADRGQWVVARADSV